MLSIATGVLVTVLTMKSLGQLTELPGFAWPMLAPMVLGSVTLVISMLAVVKEQPFKQAAGLFGIGLLGIATPFLLGLVVLALIIAVIVAALAQS